MTRALRPNEAQFLPERHSQLPELGRLPPGANRLLGVWWAGKLLYPQTFDFDLRAKVTEFHRLFCHRGPTAAQLDALVGEPGVLPP